MRNQRAFFDDLAQSADNAAKQNILLIGVGRPSHINEEYGYGHQPIYGTDTQKPIGAEALLRWKNAEFGEVLPLTFLSEVEREGSFIELGYWILRNAMKDGMAFIDSFPASA